MIIRLSEKNDINSIVSLWHEAFGDSEDEIMFFLNNKYIPANALIAEKDGEVASMLFLLEGKMHIKDADYPSYYLYAACTANKYRGRGYMAKLLDEANRIAQQRGFDFICLMPGEKSLFDFYEKHGYKAVFSKRILKINLDDSLCTDESVHDGCVDSELLRNSAFSRFDYFKWDRQSVDFAFKHTEMYSGRALTDCKGYLLYAVDGDAAYVKEFAFAEKDFENGIGLLKKLSGCNRAVINLPSEYETTLGEYETAPSAMLHPISEHSYEIINNLNNLYLGLTLD